VTVLGMHAASFELVFRPNLELIAVVRRFVENFYVQILDRPDVTSKLALATHELLENAVKYSSNGETTIRIDIHRLEDQQRVVIETVNRTSETHRHALLHLLEEMNAASDAFAFYQEIMHRSARRREGSGLGIARIRAEADMDIKIKLEDEDRVHIFAGMDVAAEEQSWAR
jgi:hypothetical protein